MTVRFAALLAACFALAGPLTVGAAAKAGYAPPEIAAADEEAAGNRCSVRSTSGTSCHEGNNRKASGSGKKVYGDRWPRLSGLLWISKTAGKRTYEGTDDNDEILSHHASDTIYGYGGNDIIWGDFDPKSNPTSQKDTIDGGAGDDWLYPSHGKNTIRGGPGKDFVYAYYGRGTIDCGPGKQDTAKIRLGTGQYKVKNCERILNFCSYGASGPGTGARCLKPGERKAVRTTR